MNIPILQIGLVVFVFGALIAAGFLGFHFLRKSTLGKQIGIPSPKLRRLSIIERSYLDNGRKLLLVRRDNIEHLVMIGGPIDILIEAGIERARAPYERHREVTEAATRPSFDKAATRDLPMGAEKMTAEKTNFAPQPELSLSPTPRPHSRDDDVILEPTPLKDQPTKEPKSIQ